ncbi:MAG: class I tRNA ligase family protein, partial [Aequorivita sp.]|nr:class I tRNA ligase family protein [Aequorivita sp.]
NGLVLDKNGQKMSKRLGNAVDPFETLDVFGPDATRWYMISNANPWDNLKFDQDGISEVRNKFFGTLYNTYSFFSLYANLDNFQYLEKDLPLEKRPEIDRWILSELHTLIQKVDDYYADYEPTKATRAISEFVQENLSNWFVRLSRRRYWKGSYNDDKISAYQTLYTCLETVAKLGAPVAPFFMDRLYIDLTQGTAKDKNEPMLSAVEASVHLTDFPKADASFIDKNLEHKMQKAQTISSLVLSLRQREKIKVRQPLQKIMIPVLEDAEKEEILAVSDLIKSEVNVKEIELIDEGSGLLVKQIKPDFKTLGPRFGKDMKTVATAISGFDQKQIATLEKDGEITVSINEKNTTLALDDVIISSQDIEGWLVANADGVTVALDVTITPDLKNEGIARELVNRIQNLRKDSGFEVTDRIEVMLQNNEKLIEAVNQNLRYIKEETLTEVLQFQPEINNGTEIAFDEIETRISIIKN